MKPQTILILVLVFIVILAIVIFLYLKKKEEERKRLEQQQAGTRTGTKLTGLLGTIGSLLGIYTQVKDTFWGPANTGTPTGTSTPFYPTPDGTLPKPLYNPLM